MRITENSMTNRYLKNLQGNLSNLSNSNLKLSSKRKYNHVSEDVGNASRAFSVRTQINKNQEQTNTVENAIGELNTASENVMTVSSVLKTVYSQAIKVQGATTQENMDAIAESLSGLKNEILQTMNASYGDKFLFSGSGNAQAPFSLDTDGNLLFNGVKVDDATAFTDFKENKVVYLDVGFGMSSPGAEIGPQTGIKISTSGVDVLGYGMEDGQPKNIYSLISKMEKEIRSGDKEAAGKTLKVLQSKEENISIAISEIGTRQNILDRTKDRLDGERLHLQERQNSLESINLEEESINNKSYEMAWMITLQLGSSIIPPSIFDFMR